MGAKQWEGRGGETTFPVTGEGAVASRSHEGSDLFGFFKLFCCDCVFLNLWCCVMHS